MQQSHCRMFARLEVGGGSTVVTVAMEWGRRSWLTWLLSTSTWYGCVVLCACVGAIFGRRRAAAFFSPSINPIIQPDTRREQIARSSAKIGGHRHERGKHTDSNYVNPTQRLESPATQLSHHWRHKRYWTWCSEIRLRSRSGLCDHLQSK